MKVHQLRQLLDALPDEFVDAEVGFHSGDKLYHVNIVLIDPWTDVGDERPWITLMEQLVGFTPPDGAMVQAIVPPAV